MRKSPTPWVVISLSFALVTSGEARGGLTENRGQIGVQLGQSFVTQQLEN